MKLYVHVILFVKLNHSYDIVLLSSPWFFNKTLLVDDGEQLSGAKMSLLVYDIYFKIRFIFAFLYVGYITVLLSNQKCLYSKTTRRYAPHGLNYSNCWLLRLYNKSLLYPILYILDYIVDRSL